MRTRIIRKLACPACRHKLRLMTFYEKRGDELIHGLARCVCRFYPIINGVLFLEDDKITAKAIYLLRTLGRKINTKNEIPFYLLNFRTGRLLLRLTIELLILVKFRTVSLQNFVKRLHLLGFVNRGWVNFYRKRGKDPHLNNSVKTVRSLSKRGWTLDLGCGQGHQLRVLTTSSDRLIGVDKDIIALYIASKYICPGANYIYLDMGKTTPFPSNYFSLIYAEDSFHFMENQEGAAKEMVRIVKAGGGILLAWLHNSVYFPEDKYSRKLSLYPSLFPKMRYKCVDPEDLKEIRNTNGAIDKYQTINLVFSKDGRVREQIS